MHRDLRITWKGVPVLPEAEAEVQARVHALEAQAAGPLRWEVIIDQPHRHYRRGALYEVSVEITASGEAGASHSLAGEDHANVDLLRAIRDSFDALQRRLQVRVPPNSDAPLD